MQLVVIAAILGLAQSKVNTRVSDHSVLAVASTSKSLARTEKTMEQCVQVFSKFIPQEGRTKDQVVEYGTDYCATTVSPITADDTYVCQHFKEFLEDSFIDFVKETPLSAQEACAHTEYHLHELRVQSLNVPNVAGDNATVDEFFVHGDCVPAVEAQMKGKKTIPKSKAPDFWYTFCVSQDCAHYLPSRHRWCTINHAPTPTHSNAVCLLVQSFAKQNLGKIKAKELDAEGLCTIYAGFMDEVLHNAEAYEFVVHEGSKKNIVEPTDPGKALVHSQLLNDVSKHFLRDNAAKPVTPDHESGAPSLKGMGAILLALSAFACSA